MDSGPDVAGLKLAKQMQRLGFPQNTLYSWVKDLSGGSARPELRLTQDCGGAAFVVAAPTASEMLAWLPSHASVVRTDEESRRVRGWKEWVAEEDVLEISHEGDTKAEALASLCVFLAKWYASAREEYGYALPSDFDPSKLSLS